MKCPVCKEPNLVISERKGIEIDYCPECRGIWLDRGELDKLMEKSRAEEGAPQYDKYSQQGNHKANQYEKPYKRKKSIFEELFD